MLRHPREDTWPWKICVAAENRHNYNPLPKIVMIKSVKVKMSRKDAFPLVLINLKLYPFYQVVDCHWWKSSMMLFARIKV